MKQITFLPLFLLLIFALPSQGQKKECRLRPKRFPSAFTHLSSDYSGMSLQADIIPKRYYQFESALGFGALFQTRENERLYGYNSNLFRIGIGSKLEARLVFGFPGNNIHYNNPEIEKLTPPVGAGIKVNLLAESSSTPGIALLTEYLFYNTYSHIEAMLIVDKYIFKAIKLNAAAGPRIGGGSSQLNYSLGFVMKDRDNRMGVYSLATNRYAYMENIFHMGIVYSDNLNYQLSAGYGVHQNDGLFMMSYTGIITYSGLQRRFGSYFR
ncbi:MAG: hypothetical protein IPM71_00010 [Bacteroidota bacterium]|nr:MAG: hypothetical protein IPM71_00010 [Bacteroidota bacterium]